MPEQHRCASWRLNLCRTDDENWSAQIIGPSGRALVTTIAHKDLIRWTVQAARRAAQWVRAQTAARRATSAGAVSGAWLDSVRRIAKKLARAKVIRKMLRGARTVLRNPTVAKAVGLASFIPVVGQGIAVAYGGARAADALLSRARRGDPAALESLDQVRQGAQEGQPAAQIALRTLEAASRAERAQQQAIPAQRAAAAGALAGWR